MLIKWRDVIEKMRREGVPFTLAELAVDGNDLREAGVPPQQIGATLKNLLFRCAQDGRLNTREKLLDSLKGGLL